MAVAKDKTLVSQSGTKWTLGRFGMVGKAAGKVTRFVARSEMKRLFESDEETLFSCQETVNGEELVRANGFNFRLYDGRVTLGCERFNKKASDALRRWAR